VTVKQIHYLLNGMLHDFMLPTVFQQDSYDRGHFLTVRSPDWTPKTRGMISSTLLHMILCNDFPKTKSTDQNKRKLMNWNKKIEKVCPSTFCLPMEKCSVRLLQDAKIVRNEL